MYATPTDFGFDLAMTRGDTDGLTVDMTVTTESVDAQGNTTSTTEVFDAQTAVLTVRTSRLGEEVFQVEATSVEDGRAIFDFPPELTAGLDAGKYVYDVQAVTSDGVVKTPLGGLKSPCKFIIYQDVTYAD